MFKRKKKQHVLERSEGEVLNLDTNVSAGQFNVSVTQTDDTVQYTEGLRASRQVINY